MTAGRCPGCGALAIAGRRFCSACGQRLTAEERVSDPEGDGSGKAGPSLGSPLPALRGSHGARAPGQSTARSGSPATPAPVDTTVRPWLRATVTVSLAVVIVAIAAAVVLAGHADESASTVDVDTGGAPAEAPTAQESPATAPVPGFRRHVGRFYTVEVPDSWQTTFEDRLLSRNPTSLVTRWEDPFEAVLTVTTSSPLTGTIAEDCRSIFDDRDRSSVVSAPRLTDIDGQESCEFSYVRSDGQSRVEYVFAIGGREFLVTAGARNRRDAEEIARHAAATLQSTAQP